MSIYYHGTSIQNAEKIIKEGFKNNHKNWSTSTSLAYFYKYEDEQTNIQKALLQAGNPAFKEENVCKRAVLALDVNDSFVEPDSDSQSKGNFQYTQKVLGPENVVGFWHDKYNLMPIRWFYIFEFLKYPDINNIEIPNDILPLRTFFSSIQTFLYKVPLVEVFNKTGINFETHTFKYSI